MGPGAGLGRPAVRQVVRGRHAQRGVQLRRPARRGRAAATGSRSTGSASPRTTPASLTYAELKDEVCKAANALTELGVQKGDRVAIYMPMILETVVAMLACARIGAPHTVVFGGFSSDALATRVVDCEVKVIITADGGYRRGAASALKPAVDEARAKVEEQGGRGRQGARRQAHRPGRRVGRRRRRVVARHRRQGVDRARAGVLRLRAPALRHVHLRLDRQAQGHPAHDRRLPRPARPTRTGRSSTSSPRPTSTGAPPTSAG